MTATDHILAGLLTLASLSQLFAHVDPARYTRLQFYAAGIVTAFVLAEVPLVFWSLEDRPISGFGLHGWTGRGDVFAGAAWALALIAAVVAIRRRRERPWLAGIYRHYDWIMPRTRSELAASWATSLAAGTGEEIAFRGFLLWYASALLGTPAGLLAASLLFGIMHAYQRARGMAWATLAGLVLGLAYLASGSLLLVIWMHATWNIASFTVGRIVLAGEAGTGEAGRLPL